jgi:hypothetical protein
MKLDQSSESKGSVLVITILTLTILTFLCATSLYVASQNLNSGMQTSSWQQSLSGSETGIDLAIRALNISSTSPSTAWAGWTSVQLPSASALPTAEPTSYANASPVPVGPPDNTHYNYLPSSNANASLSVTNTEGAKAVSTWVTIDTAGMLTSQDTNGKQWYRVRATGQTAVAGPARASGNKLDNSLRNTIGLLLNRKGGTFLGPTRTVEVILTPLSNGGWLRAITLSSQLTISGSGIIDSFNSTSALYSTNGMYDLAHHLTHGDVGTTNSSGSAISGSAHLFGSLAWSGPAVSGANATTVSGSFMTPFNPKIPGTYDPAAKSGNSGWTWSNTTPQVNANWGPNSTTTYTGGGGLPKNSNGNTVTSFTATSTDPTAPTFIVVNGDFTVSGSNTFSINSTTNDPNNPNHIIIWVKGKFTTSGNAILNQAVGTRVTWIVDNDITTSGDSYQNPSGRAINTAFVQVTGGEQNANGSWPNPHKVTISGSGNFIGQVDAPGSTMTVSGGGSLVGAAIASNLTVSGGSGFHYDEALSGAVSSTLGNYAFASWFEDNSAPAHGINY